jgi:hypothetical protein
MRRGQRIAIVCASLLLLSLSGLVSGTAYAGSDGFCYTGRACLYENYDFNNGNTDHWRDFTRDYGDFRQLVWLNNQGSQTSDHMDNETSSIKNRRGCTFRLWQDVGYKGAYSDFSNGINDGYLANNAIKDNRASSIDIFCA